MSCVAGNANFAQGLARQTPLTFNPDANSCRKTPIATMLLNDFTQRSSKRENLL
jgi:hypothetical protein